MHESRQRAARALEEKRARLEARRSNGAPVFAVVGVIVAILAAWVVGRVLLSL
jgi:hypothetical protein